MSDTHLVADGRGHYASDPAYKLQKAIQSINKYHKDADFVVITGDLIDQGDSATYRDLKEILNDLTMPYYLIIGNHDNRENYMKVFADRFEYDVFAHQSKVHDGKLFLFLDTKFGDLDGGGFCESRLKWLDAKLSLNESLPAYLFMHHPPFTIYHQQMDTIGFEPKQAFWDIIKKTNTVKHIFFGHAHLLVSGVYEGVAYSSTRSTNHQIALLPKDKSLYFNSKEQPTYAIVHITSHQTNYISHEYLNEEDIYPSFIPHHLS
jgi:3',5'-cyclic AMP phosphodiesterase CpdA